MHWRRLELRPSFWHQGQSCPPPGQYFAKNDGDGESERSAHERDLGIGVGGKVVGAEAFFLTDGHTEQLKDIVVDVPGEREQRWKSDRYQSFSGADIGRPTQYPDQKCDDGERREKLDLCACRHGRRFVRRRWKPTRDHGRYRRLKDIDQYNDTNE